MFTLAHLSDLHLAAAQPPLAKLLSKRGLGFINWQRKRKFIHRPEVLDAMTRDLKSQSFDHIAVTGDLVNLALPEEYLRAQQWLQTLADPHDVTVVPGNHDVYVREAVEQYPAAILGRLHARRRRPRPFSVSAPARRRGFDRALDRLADSTAAGDRLPRQPAACAPRRCTRSNARSVPRRSYPSPAEKPAAAFSAPPDRRAGITPRAGRQGRRASDPRPRSS